MVWGQDDFSRTGFDSDEVPSILAGERSYYVAEPSSMGKDADAVFRMYRPNLFWPPVCNDELVRWEALLALEPEELNLAQVQSSVLAPLKHQVVVGRQPTALPPAAESGREP